MKKNILAVVLSVTFFSCASLSYNYDQFEFVDEYNKTVKYFDRVVESPIKKSDLRKLRRRFNFLRNQLYKNNENYERINEMTVKSYSEKIEEYLMFVEDLSD
ncbi:hypothetical protein I6E17_04575 [Fusobacterium perfoetens]|uniref:hypothetical protein n=1 Tax=Fusobacterium perfoetens TaxID=852 RepID=UPI001F3669BE|nr:hypothetical protein [Fusobacterium perfoetens]MCF2625454.1 hypothetical protein [Fusobacterium perfoetens]